MDKDFRSSATWETLRQRSELLQKLRAFFLQSGYVEVETPLLLSESIIDCYLDPLVTQLRSPHVRSLQGKSLYLQTSPELGMKRLLASGAESIFQIGKAFRDDEFGDLHNPEFTLCEWYCLGDKMADQVNFLGELCQTMLNSAEPEVLTYAEAFQRSLGLNPLDCELADLLNAAANGNTPSSFAEEEMDRDDVLNWLLSEKVELSLGQDRPTILTNYPASQAALAELDPELPGTACRFELYVKGIELANGYQELLDSQALRERSQLQQKKRIENGKAKLSPPESLFAAMDAGLPTCSGVALGYDRLAMLALGKTTIAEVIPFPADRI
ncbi:EF-P lysine aminoacylase GenX [Planctomycetales bacterium 10988]|nr:EF-P lysine aminoacylase GenX [Planctomycetales bacterium 10988]